MKKEIQLKTKIRSNKRLGKKSRLNINTYIDKKKKSHKISRKQKGGMIGSEEWWEARYGTGRPELDLEHAFLIINPQIKKMKIPTYFIRNTIFKNFISFLNANKS